MADPTDAGAQALQELLTHFDLERVDETLFRGTSRDPGWGRIYGGQVLGQALVAASRTVPLDRHAHSLHAYFLRPGNASLPVDYIVDPIRNGRSFCTRRVVASQDGEAIFHLSASFQPEEPGFDHHAPPPEVPSADSLDNDFTHAQKIAERLPPRLAKRTRRPGPIETRPVRRHDPIAPDRSPPERHVWFRARGSLPTDPMIHRALLAFASDTHFLVTSLQPHGASWLTPGIQMASLDHAMWIHRPFRMDEWLLYAIDSPSASGARGLVRGQFFQHGRLVASTVQEGLVRDRRPS
ncbi:MAG: acyl-CoA thioesterase II [Deltaproteobacteria bacterium]|nr:acyl-CoA thioesterase II [Deltaproteobacteria bacterium]HCH62566.1 acyl-CoA thioesterase II [Deltaproteobacteria bacterium]